MKEQHFITNIILTFWFGWFALAGVAITAVINWAFTMHFHKEDMLLAGATIGIISGGVAALVFYLIGKHRNLQGFGQHFNPFNVFQKRQ